MKIELGVKIGAPDNRLTEPYEVTLSAPGDLSIVRRAQTFEQALAQVVAELRGQFKAQVT